MGESEGMGGREGEREKPRYGVICCRGTREIEIIRGLTI